MLTLVTLSGVKLTGCGGFDLTGMILLYSIEGTFYKLFNSRPSFIFI